MDENLEKGLQALKEAKTGWTVLIANLDNDDSTLWYDDFLVLNGLNGNWGHPDEEYEGTFLLSKKLDSRHKVEEFYGDGLKSCFHKTRVEKIYKNIRHCSFFDRRELVWSREQEKSKASQANPLEAAIAMLPVEEWEPFTFENSSTRHKFINGVIYEEYYEGHWTELRESQAFLCDLLARPEEIYKCHITGGKRFIPEIGGTYYTISNLNNKDFKVIQRVFSGDTLDLQLYLTGNMFQIKEEAERPESVQEVRRKLSKEFGKKAKIYGGDTNN